MTIRTIHSKGNYGIYYKRADRDEAQTLFFKPGPNVVDCALWDKLMQEKKLQRYLDTKLLDDGDGRRLLVQPEMPAQVLAEQVGKKRKASDEASES